MRAQVGDQGDHGRGDSRAAAVFVAAPARAGPTDNPCELAVTFLCQFVPIAPNLEDDVDLTQQLPPADPAAPPP